VVVFGIFSFGKKLLSVTASSLQESLWSNENYHEIKLLLILFGDQTWTKVPYENVCEFHNIMKLLMESISSNRKIRWSSLPSKILLH
jgi:hypothetical protein